MTALALPRFSTNSCLRKAPLACLIILASTCWSQQGCTESTKCLNLKGVVITRTFRGAPGFGESPKIDAVISVHVLRLNTIKTVSDLLSSENTTFSASKRIREVQLDCDTRMFPQCESVLDRARGHLLCVSGKASQAPEPGEFLNVSFEVIQVIPCEKN